MDKANSGGDIQRSPNKILRFFINVILPLAALCCGIAITYHLLQTGPEAKPKKRPPTAALVEVIEVKSIDQRAYISGMGEIVPAEQVELKPRVSGEIVEINPDFSPGGYFNSGETMLRIDSRDYELIEEQLASQADQARSDLVIEMGNQRIAQRELTLLGEDVKEEEKELILRQPQLKQLQAASRFADSKLEKARLDLERTSLKAPFNGVVTEKNVTVGTRVIESTVLTNLVGTDLFWLRLTVPVQQLNWISIPERTGEHGSRVKIKVPSGGFREGEVIRLEAELESQGRMARLLIAIDDPLSLEEENRAKPKLLLGSYVSAEIEGKTVHGVRISRADLHDNDTVWLMDDEGRLEIRPVEILFREKDHVIVNGSLDGGERLITTTLSSPIPGTLLRVEGDKQAEAVRRQGEVQGEGRKSGEE